MKKTKLALLLCILVIVFCACSKNEEGEQDNTGSTPTEAVTPTESATPTLEVTPTAEITPSAEPTGEVTPTPTEEPTPTEDPAVTDINTLMAGTEQIGVTDKVLLNDVLVTYYDYLTEYMNDSEYADFDRTRYGLAFIDGDQIPELLIADNDNHGTGVKVIFYNNGEPVEVGQFGSEGGFSYIKYENRIISFYMGYGTYTTDIYHIEQDFSSKADYEFYDSDEEACTVNGEETEYTRYEELLDEARESKLGNKRLLVEYETLMRYYPYSNEELVTFSLIRMFQELREAEFESFPVYFNDDLRKIEDNWSLIESKAETADASFKYDVVKDNGNKEGYKTYSEVIISEYSGVGIWLSAYKNDDSLDALNITEYNMPMVYCESEEDDAKYRWYAKAFPEDEQFNWEMKLYYDENSDHLIIKLDRPDSEDAVTLTYERHWEEYEVHSLEVELTRREDYDSTRGKAFEAKEYLIVSADDAELIKEYGLPEDLDGYDYEIVYPDKDTFIIYVDEYTSISIVSFEDGYHMEEISTEDFCNREYFGTYEVSFEDYNPDGDYNGMMAVSVTEKYTG